MKRTLIAITGGIGSGKSAVLNILKQRGYRTLSCDKTVGNLYRKRRVLKHLREIFPTAIKGKLFLRANKKEIAKVAFNDEEKYKLLTGYLTSLALEETLKKAKGAGGKIFVEVPLLFEFNAQDNFDKIVIIKRQKDYRINAVKERSNLSEQEILERINKQVDYDVKFPDGYIIIENNGSKKELREKVLFMAKKIGKEL